MDSYNLASALYDMAASRPNALAIALPARPGKPLPAQGPVPYREVSFRELAYETNCIARGLLASGFQCGDRVVLMVPPSLEFFALSFAFLQSGIIPVLIDPGIGIRNLKKCIDEAQPVGFIGVSKAHVARILLGWGRSFIQKKVTIGPRLFWGGALLKKIKACGRSDGAPEYFNARSDDLSAIVFTSGSTGVPKGVMSTHGIMRQQVEIIRSTYDIRPGEIDLPTFPPFAVFNPVLGLSTVIPDMDPPRPAEVDPESYIRDHQYVRFSGPDRPGGTVAASAQDQPSQPEKSVFGRSAGTCQRTEAVFRHARSCRRDIHTLRGYRSNARNFYR